MAQEIEVSINSILWLKLQITTLVVVVFIVELVQELLVIEIIRMADV